MNTVVRPVDKVKGHSTNYIYLGILLGMSLPGFSGIMEHIPSPSIRERCCWK